MRSKYEYVISEVAMEISIDSYWRNKILHLNKNEKLKINYEDNMLPSYIMDYVYENKLSFYVEIVDECEEEFDDGLVVFKFTSAEFSDITAFSGNNPEVI